MYTAADLRKGLRIELDGEPYIVTEFQFSKPGKGQALYRCRLKSMLTGLVIGNTTGHFRRTLGRARLAAPDSGTGGPDDAHVVDELGVLDGALRELRRDRDVYRGELLALHDATAALGVARGPADAVERAVDVVRTTLAPYD